jgi:MoaA/NifB/PqqE/SkfB family radical SAM enzyme
MLAKTAHQIQQQEDDQLLPADAVSFLELEITSFCQLKCTHCYSESGPHGGRGTMTTPDWERVIDQAATLGIGAVQFIGGEPALDPDLPRLIRYALRAGLKVDVYTNLVHVTPELFELFSEPGVSLGTSWYSADPDKHAEVTGSRASYARTRANIIEAVRRGIPVRAGIVEVVAGQDIAQAEAELRAMGVTSMHADRARGVGRAASGREPIISELCGRCGRGRAAIGLDGQVTPCVLGRFLVTGNVREDHLGDILAGERWRQIVASVPPAGACVSCQPADSNDCDPSRKP